MKYESVIELKNDLITRTLRRLSLVRGATDIAVRSRSLAAKVLDENSRRPWMSGLALGVSMRGKTRDFVLAVRVQDRQLLHSPVIDEIRRKAKGEVDIRYTGAIRSLAKRRSISRAGHWYRLRLRPLEIGTSIAHKDVTAGTIGAFVHRGRSGAWYILSNNHVLANVNEATRGDEILQPGPADGGRLREEDIVALLAKYVPISFSAPNLVDCAIAKVREGVEVVPSEIHGIGTMTGVREDDVDILMQVKKLGRTTGLKTGRVTAIALDDVGVDMDTGVASFDNQIEIESVVRTKPFCRGGDSGSLIVDEDGCATALLFAGSDEGGLGNQGLTYANPISAVISSLGIRF